MKSAALLGLGLLAVLLGAPATRADELAGANRDTPPLAAFHAEYEVWRNGSKIGAAEMDLSKSADGNWQFRNASRGTNGLAALAAAEINEDSVFRWRDNRPELVSYHYRQSAAFSKRQRSLVVGPDGSKVAADDGKHQGEIAFEAGLIDRNVVILALAADFSRGAHEFNYRVADKLKVSDQNYIDDGTEKTVVPAGTFDTHRMKRVRKNSDRITTTWLAPSQRNLPVRIEQREPEGEVVELRLLKPIR